MAPADLAHRDMSGRSATNWINPPRCPRRRHEGLSMRFPLRFLLTPPLVTLQLAALLTWGSAFPLAGLSLARAEEFTDAQRAEIVKIVRDALKQDPSILREAVVALQADDGEREKISSRAAVAASRDSLITPNDPIGGNPHGNVTIVEFFDVRCPYCRKLEPEMTELLAGDHDVRLVYKDLPILGPASVVGTKALLAAQKQNAYEKLRDVVMRMPPDITRAGIETEAKKLGLDTPRLLHDMDDPSIQQRIDANLHLAQRLNIQGTPAMIIGDEMLPGAVDAGELKQAVAEARAAKK
jgi:protein-disulfide isomerase